MQRINQTLISLVCCLFFAVVSVASADEIPKIKGFADSLFAKGDYYRAITEYERLIYLFPAHEHAVSAEYMAALAYYSGNHYGVSMTRFENLYQAHATTPLGKHAAAMVVWCLIKEHRYGVAFDFIDARKESLDSVLGLPLRVRIAAACLIANNEGIRAQQMAMSEHGEPDEPSAATFRMIEESMQEPDKSPMLAGALSAIVPGAGQLYIGRRSDALTSFIINGILIAACVSAFENDEYVAGGMLALLESGWYAGNVYNAVNGAYKTQRARKERLLQELEVSCGLMPSANGGVMFGTTLNLSF